MLTLSYEYAGPFYGDRACVIKNKKIGYIDFDGSKVIDIIWDEVNCGKQSWKHENGRYISQSEPWAVRKDEKWGYINRDGKIIIPLQFDHASLFDNNRARIKIDNKWGYINISGDLVIEPVYDDIGIFKCIGKKGNKSYYSALVKKYGKFGFINEDGKYITKPLISISNYKFSFIYSHTSNISILYIYFHAIKYNKVIISV